MGKPRAIKAAEREYRKRIRRKRKIILFGLISVCLLAVLLIVLGHMSAYIRAAGSDRIQPNVYIGGQSVGGLTEAEARRLLKANEERLQAVDVTFQVGDQAAAVKAADLGLHYHKPEQLIKAAAVHGNQGHLLRRYAALKKLEKQAKVFEERFALTEKTAAAALNKQLTPLYSHARNAQITRSEGRFVITAARAGKTIDMDKTLAKVTRHLNRRWDYQNFRLKAAARNEKPQVQAADLESIRDELGRFATNAGGGVRLTNIKTGAGKINGLVVFPGEEISFTKLVVPFSAENGYVPAGSYENGTVVDTYGGGICQVSTTLYNALLRAELAVVKRYPHSLKVPYVELSQDAAIAEGYKDLIFRNNYQTPIYIEAGVGADGQLAVAVFGQETRAAARRVEYESETLTTQEYGTKYRTDPAAALGELESGGNPHNGATARLWKNVYEDDRRVSREVVNNSTYNKSDRIITVGTRSDNDQARRLVSQAVATQDRDKINAALASARQIIAAARPQTEDAQAAGPAAEQENESNE